MPQKLEALTIGALAKAAGVNVETIRFYQRKGLLPEPARPLGGIRRYGNREVRQLCFVKAAQKLGFSLVEIAELLALDRNTDCAEVRAIAEMKLADVRAKLANLARMESALSALVGTCHTRQRDEPCPLIDALYDIGGDKLDGVG
jgi:MerR family mercuric resistance operon transcriptional regulator